MKLIAIIIGLILSSQSISIENIDQQYVESNNNVRRYCLENESDNIWYSYINPYKNSKTYGYYGYKNATNNEIMIPAQYIIMDECFDNINDQFYVAVRDDNKGWVYIDKNGINIVQAYNVDSGPDIFREGFSRYVENGKVGFINENLEIVIPAQFDDAYLFENGFAKVCNGCQRDPNVEYSKLEGGEWGIVDKEGNVLWEKE